MDFQASQLQSTETTMPMPIKKNRKSNLEEDLLAGGTDVGRTGHLETVAAPVYFGVQTP